MFYKYQFSQKPQVATMRGFTIVELLIVIVVIAILAAITIVAYNGIQARAKLTQQTAQIDKIGKAIQLWQAENGKSFSESGAGWGGGGYGFFTAKSPAEGYVTLSIEDLLRNSGYLAGSIEAPGLTIGATLLAPCTATNQVRWVVLATVSPAPTKPVAEQVSETGCTFGLVTAYSTGNYTTNLVRVY